MLGVQSCKHFGCQRSHPMILGFGHPSGALEDGARGKILVFKQWKWTDYYIMWSLCIVESTVLARQTKKLSKFEVRDEFCQQYKMPGGTNFFRGTKFFYDWPYLGCFDFLLRKWLAGQIFSGAQNFFTGYPILKKFVPPQNFGVVHGKSATLTPGSKNKKIAFGNFFVFGARHQLRWKKYSQRYYNKCSN